ncbi:MAG: DUF488 family protein [Bacteroides sp.]|nr:DUF488 family protein [Bacteroides sp.]
MTEIKIKRAYDGSDPGDGYRIYVDRLWPRGLSHETFHYDLWVKDLAPSTELREWFHADQEDRWDEFQRRYADELRSNPSLESLRGVVESHPVVTLIYSTHTPADRSNAFVLKTVLESK